MQRSIVLAALCGALTACVSDPISPAPTTLEQVEPAPAADEAIEPVETPEPLETPIPVEDSAPEAVETPAPESAPEEVLAEPTPAAPEPVEPVPTEAPAETVQDAPLLVRKDGEWVPAEFSEDELNRAGMLCIRHNNYWCVKSSGWNGETGKDERDHAIFESPDYGARAFFRLMRTYWYRHGLRSTHEIFDRYAPADDCIGSVPRDPETGECPNGPNPTFAYAQSVAAALGVGVDDSIELFDDTGAINRDVAHTLARAVMKFELGRKYDVSDQLLDDGLSLAGL